MSRLRFESESVLIYSARFTLRKDLWQDPPFNEILAGFLAHFCGLFLGNFIRIFKEFLQDSCRILGSFHFMGFSFKFLSKSLQDSWRILGGFLEDSWRILGSFHIMGFSFKLLSKSLQDSCGVWRILAGFPAHFHFLGFSGRFLEILCNFLRNPYRILAGLFRDDWESCR